MKCLVCGDWDVTWVQTVMHNEREGYEEYSCNCCKGRSEYGVRFLECQYTGKNDVCPYEQG